MYWSSRLAAMDNNWELMDSDETKLVLVNRWASFINHLRRFQRLRRIWAVTGHFLKSRKALGVLMVEREVAGMV